MKRWAMLGLLVCVAPGSVSGEEKGALPPWEAAVQQMLVACSPEKPDPWRPDLDKGIEAFLAAEPDWPGDWRPMVDLYGAILFDSFLRISRFDADGAASDAPVNWSKERLMREVAARIDRLRAHSEFYKKTAMPEDGLPSLARRSWAQHLPVEALPTLFDCAACYTISTRLHLLELEVSQEERQALQPLMRRLAALSADAFCSEALSAALPPSLVAVLRAFQERLRFHRERGDEWALAFTNLHRLEVLADLGGLSDAERLAIYAALPHPEHAPDVAALHQVFTVNRILADKENPGRFAEAKPLLLDAQRVAKNSGLRAVITNQLDLVERPCFFMKAEPVWSKGVARIEITGRNITELTCALYPLTASPHGGLWWAETHHKPDAAATWTIPFSDAPDVTAKAAEFPVSALPSPGAYLLTVSNQAGAAVNKLVITVADLTAALYQTAPSEVQFFVTSAHEGAPAEGALITVYTLRAHSGEAAETEVHAVTNLTTDASGCAVWEIKERVNHDYFYDTCAVIEHRGERIQLNGIEVSRGRPDYDMRYRTVPGVVYADRPGYAPGETVNLFALGPRIQAVFPQGVKDDSYNFAEHRRFTDEETAALRRNRMFTIAPRDLRSESGESLNLMQGNRVLFHGRTVFWDGFCHRAVSFELPKEPDAAPLTLWTKGAKYQIPPVKEAMLSFAPVSAWKTADAPLAFSVDAPFGTRGMVSFFRGEKCGRIEKSLAEIPLYTFREWFRPAWPQREKTFNATPYEVFPFVKTQENPGFAISLPQGDWRAVVTFESGERVEADFTVQPGSGETYRGEEAFVFDVECQSLRVGETLKGMWTTAHDNGFLILELRQESRVVQLLRTVITGKPSSYFEIPITPDLQGGFTLHAFFNSHGRHHHAMKEIEVPMQAQMPPLAIRVTGSSFSPSGMMECLNFQVDHAGKGRKLFYTAVIYPEEISEEPVPLWWRDPLSVTGNFRRSYPLKQLARSDTLVQTYDESGVAHIMAPIRLRVETVWSVDGLFLELTREGGNLYFPTHRWPTTNQNPMWGAWSGVVTNPNLEPAPDNPNFTHDLEPPEPVRPIAAPLVFEPGRPVENNHRFSLYCSPPRSGLQNLRVNVMVFDDAWNSALFTTNYVMAARSEKTN